MKKKPTDSVFAKIASALRKGRSPRPKGQRVGLRSTNSDLFPKREGLEKKR